jgi:hypothetical protein
VYDENCLLHGTDWVFKYSSLCLVCDENCLLRGTDWIFKYKSLCLFCDENCLLRGTDWVFKYKSLCLFCDENCLLRGTDWVFKYSSLPFVFKGLMKYILQYRNLWSQMVDICSWRHRGEGCGFYVSVLNRKLSTTSTTTAIQYFFTLIKIHVQ